MEPTVSGLTYRVKVINKPEDAPTFLWGGLDVLREFDRHLLLFLRVDENGEEIRFGVSKFKGLGNDQPKTEIYGRLKPGEAYVIDVKGLRGVFANCEFDTFVMCGLIPQES